jgi:nucleoside-diphosphate-sugar epimerase
MSVLITGPSGFVGQRLLQRIGIDAVGLSTRTEPAVWGQALARVHCVVHLAARVHQMRDTADDPLQEFRKINVDATMELARQAVKAGVQRFIFVSSVKVNGEKTGPDCPFRPDDIPEPQDAYGISKMEAEAGLRAIGSSSGMEVVIIRPPLVYGPGVKANFASMVRWLQLGVPLPLGAIHNQRSLVALDNLVDLVVTCIHHPAAANQTFMISDGEDVSTTVLLRLMGQALGRPALLLPVPQPLLQWGARLVGKTDMAQRLFSSLQVNMELTCQMLNWTPPLSLEQGLLQVAKSVSPYK